MHARYADRGLKVVTIYGTDKTMPKDMPALLAKRKMVHPVLLDPTTAYRETLGLGAYPVGTLIDREGRVVWQGVAWLEIFSAACAKAIQALLAEDPAKEAGSASSDR